MISSSASLYREMTVPSSLGSRTQDNDRDQGLQELLVSVFNETRDYRGIVAIETRSGVEEDREIGSKGSFVRTSCKILNSQ